MTENKRYTTDNGSNEDVCLVDNATGKEYESDFNEIVDLLNEQDNEINELRAIRKDLISVLNILRCELDIAIENGFVLENDISSKKTRYDSFWEKKIKNMEVRQQIVENSIDELSEINGGDVE